MTTYAEYQAQIAQLQKEAAAVRENEIAGAKAQIHKLMQDFNLTIADISLKPSKVAKERKTVEAKYRNPATGELWTGRGRAPRWLDSKDKADFLIK